MRSKRLLFAIVPAVLFLLVGLSAVWGERGVLARYQLEQQLQDAHVELARIDSENQRLLRDLHTMDRDPVVLERRVADELGWGREGDVLVRFSD